MAKITTENQDALAKLVLSKLFEYAEYRKSTFLDKGFSVDDWITKNSNAYASIHESDELDVYPKMRGYFPMSRIKVDSAVSWARDLMANRIVMPWVYKPTPDPELSQDGQVKVKQRLITALIADLKLKGIDATPDQLLAAGGGTMPLGVEAFFKEKQGNLASNVIGEETRIAENACKLAMRYAKDWQMSSGFTEAFVPFLRDVYGQVCGVMTTALPAKVKRKTFKGNKYARSFEDGFVYRHVHAGNAYFAPDASSASNGSGFIERTHRTTTELINMIGLDDVVDSNVQLVLEESVRSAGGWVDSIFDKSLSHGTGIDKDFSPLGQTNAKPDYQGGVETIIFQGIVSGRELEKANIIGFGKDELLECEIEVCGNRTIRATVKEGVGARTYVSTGFTEGDIPWRSSIPMLAYDGQLRVNRILYRRTQAIHQQSGAFMGVDATSWDGSAPKIEPFGVGFLNPSDGGRGVQMIQAQPTYSGLYAELLNEFYLADMATAIPRFDRDISGSAETNTATEAGIRYQAAVRRQKAVAMNLDMEALRPQGEVVYEFVLNKFKHLNFTADAMTDASGIVGGLTDGANKARMVEALMPLTNAAQGGLVPAIVVEQAYRAYAEGVGVDISRWPDPVEKEELKQSIQTEATAAQSTPAVLQPNTMVQGMPDGMVSPSAPIAATGIPLQQGQTL